MIRCDLVLSVEGEGKDMVVNTCPDEAVTFIRSAFGEVYAYCETHSNWCRLTDCNRISREEYLVHKIMGL
jgi:hypothetical protein